MGGPTEVAWKLELAPWGPIAQVTGGTHGIFRLGRYSLRVRFACFLLITASSWAQTVALRGVITDETGAVIPKAAVSIKGPVAKTTVTGDDGSYSFAGLPAGNYVVDASAPDLALPKPASVTLTSVAQ